MIQKLTRKELIGKTVMNSPGTVLGVSEEIVIDTETGEMKYLIVNPLDGQTKPKQMITDKGRAVYAFNSIVVGDTTITIE